MKRITSFVLIAAIILVAVIFLYTHFVITLSSLAATILLATVTLVIWAYSKSESGEMLDAIKERYRMNTISSVVYGRYTSIEEASKECPEDIEKIKDLLRMGNGGFQKIKFMDSLPEWTIKQAVPFLAINMPKWIIAIIIGILVLRLHDGIVAHRKDDKIQQKSDITILQLQKSSVVQNETGELSFTININSLCLEEIQNSNVLMVYGRKCN